MTRNEKKVVNQSFNLPTAGSHRLLGSPVCPGKQTQCPSVQWAFNPHTTFAQLPLNTCSHKEISTNFK